jgi:hypothetical protein
MPKQKDSDIFREKPAFKPTPLMVDIFNNAHDFQGASTIKSWFAKARGGTGSDESLWAKWQKRPGFVEWWSSEHEKFMVGNSTKAYLDNIGIERASKDFKYWQAMQMKYHGLSLKIQQDVKSDNKNLNVAIDASNLNKNDLLKVFDELIEVEEDEGDLGIS